MSKNFNHASFVLASFNFSLYNVLKFTNFEIDNKNLFDSCNILEVFINFLEYKLLEWRFL